MPLVTSSTEDLLARLEPDRRCHSLAVAAKAGSAVGHLPDDLRSQVVDAALLHDVGYAWPRLDFHPLDGAEVLAEHGFPPVVCHLVAHHSASTYEAEARGLSLVKYRAFDVDRDDLGPAHAVVWWADLTTGPRGEDWTVERRLDDIADRYPPAHVVARNAVEIRPILLAAGQSPVGSIRVRS